MAITDPEDYQLPDISVDDIPRLARWAKAGLAWLVTPGWEQAVAWGILIFIGFIIYKKATR